MYRVASIISDAVLSEGLESSLARQIAAQTLIGAGKMLLESDKSPDALISDVMSPNGTTEAGMMVFDESNIDSELSAVIKRAVARSKELSKEF